MHVEDHQAAQVERLRAAVRGGHVDALRALLSEPQRPFLDVRDPVTHRTPLMDAAERGHVRVVQSLVSRGADVNASDVHGFTPLMFAAFSGEVPSVRAILKERPFVNAQNQAGQTALMCAALGNKERVVRALIETGKADTSIRDVVGKTALDLSTCPGIRELLAVSR
jgi:ankyrin repeat protein